MDPKVTSPDPAVIGPEKVELEVDEPPLYPVIVVPSHVQDIMVHVSDGSPLALVLTFEDPLPRYNCELNPAEVIT